MIVAQTVAAIIKNLLSLVSLPVIFLSIVSSFASMENGRDARALGLRVARYTLLTTFLAAIVGVIVFFIVRPVPVSLSGLSFGGPGGAATSYADFLLQMFPSNLVEAFSGNGSVMAVVFVGLLFGGALLTLPNEEKTLLRGGFTALFSLMLAITRFILFLMPLAVWAFTAMFAYGMQSGGAQLGQLAWYTVAVLLANVLQGVIILPLLLYSKGLCPWALVSAFKRALVLAFVSKSSNMTLPVTLECAEENAGIPRRIARFCLPLCATINMNGCAAFIIITLLFVASYHGAAFGLYDVCMWLILAVAAAVGNAGVPMGCFFLTSAFLVQLHLPLDVMGLILPVYALIDMVETALNVWSDACVTAVVHVDSQQERL